MPVSFGSNISAFLASRQLARASDSAARSLERLASGLRITRASDDAAGLAVASMLSARQRVFSRAVINGNDAISLLNTASSSAQSLTGILERMKELAMQAANGSLSSQQRRSLNAEALSLTSEYNRVIESTKFNGLTLHVATEQRTQFQLGFGDSGSISAALTSGLAARVGSGQFTNSNTTNLSPTLELLVGDINGDGNADLVANNGNTGVTVVLGLGNGTFGVPIIALATASNISAMELGDMDGDGKLDIIIGMQNGTVQVARHTSGSSFTSSGGLGFANFTGNSVSDLAVGDFNNDGKLDIVAGTTHDDGGFATVLYGNGVGGMTFGTILGDTIGGSNGRVTVGDFNGDGRDDIAATNTSSPTAGIFLNTTSGSGGIPTFSTSTFITGIGASLESGDLNNDGRDDLIARSGTTSTVLLRSSTDETFLASVTTISNISDLKLADLNNDGYLDLYGLATGLTSAVRFGNGDGTFGNAVNSTLGTNSTQIAAGDFDNDGVLDIAVGGVGVLTEALVATTTKSSRLAAINLNTKADALAAVAVLDEALARVANENGVLGAALSRIESAVRTLSDSADNHAAAASRIRDADIAAETAELVRNQILQQAATSVLAQANQAPALALKLLAA